MTQDQLAIIRIDGMHSHQCELTIQSALGRFEGVYEVEVDFLSGQASVLFDPDKVHIEDLTTAIESAGYRPGACSRGGDCGLEA
ncbi:MAG TPA: heavy metal-associated domain-containing protein [Tepidisphaeraceae bacterium]